ncbi:hypothetical protein [Sulfurovum sp. TSL1]|uniref:hypothetical protein n=1 Tax=Sulfurovum sp. TSL1 TaxID=2826994 RepID=UPI001CC44A1A|nr:hypothetical protein [Sulfurovum sp. TSL1]GIT98832.1 hypothetical protein TSL1_16530 [Sulfurovum sp. TSL1]
MKTTLQLGLLYIGALALSLTLATAEGKYEGSQQGMMNNDAKCGDAQKEMKEKRETYRKEMKEKNGKCGESQKDMMDNDGKCNASMKPKPAPTKGKCGQGKCGD